MKPNNNLSLKYDLTMEDWVATVQHLTEQNSFALVINRLFGNLSFEPIVGILLAVPIVILFAGSTILAFVIYPALIAAGYWLYQRPLKEAAMVKEKLKETLPEEYLGAVQLEATGESLNTITSQGATSYHWNEVTLIEENGNHLFLTMGAGDHWVVPMQAFENQRSFINTVWRLKKFRDDATSNLSPSEA